MMPATARILPFPTQSPAIGHNGGPALDEPLPEPDLGKFRDQFEDYASVKAQEIDERRLAARYYYSQQYTDEQISVLAERGQPPIVFNLIDAVVDGTVGVLQRSRGDPRAVPRTPTSGGEGAEVATQCLRFALDQSDWQEKEGACLRQAYNEGLAVAVIEEIPGDMGAGDPDYDLADVDPTTFYYDPRSIRPDFSDARFMGVSRWATTADVDELFPGRGKDVQDALSSGSALTTAFDTDKENLWISTRGGRKRVRLVEHWYKQDGEWRVCFYAGDVTLQHERSTFFDAKGKRICRYFPLRNKVDPDGVTHGYFRRMKGPQDALNQHRSKAVHIMNVRQIRVRKGTPADEIERRRREAARPDGVLEWEQDANEADPVGMDQAFLQQTNYYQDAKQMLETFGPSSVAIAGGQDAASGRALTQMVQAGMAQIGPFLANLKQWRIGIYRALWVQQQRNWTAERFIRVTDDQKVAQFRAINEQSEDEYGRPMLVNAIGQLDVDIIVDEGPDTANVMADVFDILMTMVQNKVPVPPQVLLEMSALPQSEKDKLMQMMSQPDPAKVAEQQTVLANKQADTENKKADAAHKIAQAQHLGVIAERDQVETVSRALEAAHGHADHLAHAARGGLTPEHLIPAVQPPPQPVPQGA